MFGLAASDDAATASEKRRMSFMREWMQHETRFLPRCFAGSRVLKAARGFGFSETEWVIPHSPSKENRTSDHTPYRH